MITALAAIVAAGVILPHVLRLQRVHPVTAVVLWGSSLALRAMIGVLGIIVLLFFLPSTQLFSAITHWCLDFGVPFADESVHVEGHGVADYALLAPGFALGISLLVVCRRTARSAHDARRLVERGVVCDGPHDTLVVSGPDVVFAVAGLLHPQIVVSAGALTSLDDEELNAALAHERAHIVRRHRFVLLVAIGLAALGRALPGTRCATRELAFHLERDADRWALRHTSDRLALASVICKAAIASPPSEPALTALGTTGVRERLSQLLNEQVAHAPRTATALNALATAMAICTLILAGLVPTAAVAGVANDAHRTHHAGHCHHEASGAISDNL